MSLWSKILAGAIVFATLGFLYLTANLLRANKEWQGNIQQFKDKIAKQEEDNELLREGGANLRNKPISIDDGIPAKSPEDKADQPGIRQYASLLDQQVSRLPKGLWTGCEVSGADAATGAVQLTIERPSPHGLQPNMPVYAFEEKPAAEGGKYVGQFMVKEAAETSVTLSPLRPSPRLAEKLGQASGAWTLMSEMPTDDHAMFQKMNEDELRAMLPEASRDEFLRDGKESQPSDPQDRIVDGKFIRPLRDYAKILLDAQIATASTVDRIVSLTNDVAMMTKTVASSDARLKLLDDQITKLNQELARVKTEQATVSQHLAALEKRITEVRGANERLLAENKRLAEQSAARQGSAALRRPEAVGSLISPSAVE